MSNGAYIARSGWEQTPIGQDEWMSAAARNPKLKLAEGSSETPAVARLRRSLGRRLSWNAGCIHGERVNRELVLVMFSLAEELGARVCSERRNPYRDIDDWERRTRRRGRGSHREYGRGLSRGELGVVALMASMLLIAFIAIIFVE